MSVPVPSTPTNPADLRSPLAAFLAGWLWGESDGHLPESEFAGRAGRLADELHEQVVAPVLEGLHAELDRTRARKQTDLDALKERCGRQLATINAHIRRRDQLRADIERITRACAALIVDANKERESRIAWACEADRLQQERNALSSLLRGMARRVGDFRRDVVRIYDQGAFAIAAAREDRARPSVSDQTPTNPELKCCPAHPAAAPFNATHRCPWCEIERLAAELAEAESLRETEANHRAKLAEMLDEERQANSHETGHLDADRECMVQEIERLQAELNNVRSSTAVVIRAHELNNGALAAERDALRAERAAALDAAEARGRAEALSKAADAWQRGAWANTPRHRDQVADRVGQAQYVTEWLRERAATTAQSEGDHHA